MADGKKGLCALFARSERPLIRKKRMPPWARTAFPNPTGHTSPDPPSPVPPSQLAPLLPDCQQHLQWVSRPLLMSWQHFPRPRNGHPAIQHTHHQRGPLSRKFVASRARGQPPLLSWPDLDQPDDPSQQWAKHLVTSSSRRFFPVFCSLSRYHSRNRCVTVWGFSSNSEEVEH